MDARLLDNYQRVCRYTISNGIQLLDLPINFDQIQKEILHLLVKHNYHLEPVSLKLYKPSNDPKDFVVADETVWHNGINILQNKDINLQPYNSRPDEEYVYWHPDLVGSYTQEVAHDIEQYSGLTIGRVRLAWLLPSQGYPMHVDLEPLRFHIPLITNKHSYFIQNNQLYHMSYGSLYHLMTTTEHTGHNFGNLPRLHLVFSTHATKEVSDIITTIINEEYTIEKYYNHLESSGINKNSIASLIQIDPGYKQKYVKIITDLLSK